MTDILDVNPKFGGKVIGERLARFEDTLEHVCKRMKERYFRRIGWQQVKDWNNEILSGKAEWCCDNNDMTSEYIVYHNNRAVLALFNVSRWTIVTVLPSERLIKFIPYYEPLIKTKGKVTRKKRKSAKNVGIGNIAA